MGGDGFTVMDVPHGDSVCDALGAWRGGFEEGEGASQCPAAFSIVEKRTGRRRRRLLKKIHPPGCRGDGEAWGGGSAAVEPPESFYFCSLCSKERSTNGALGLPQPPLHFLPHNGGNVLSKLSRVANLYISRSCKHLRRSAFLQTHSGFT